MNLFDMAQRKDEALVLGPEVAPAKWKQDEGTVWRTLRVQPSTHPQITVSGILQWYPFSTRPETVGWYAKTVKGEGRLSIRFVQPDGSVHSVQIGINETPRLVPVPWPLLKQPLAGDTALDLHFVLEPGQVADLLINHLLDRAELIGLAQGNGVEIGPGPKPQVLNGGDITVKYVEEMSAGEWKDLYDKGGQYKSDDADWSHHVVGKASGLPCEDESLDFIFSSHVFEHLVNPIGHLEHWASKLRSGGVVLAIVPDVAGTKDFRHQPCLLEELIDEYRRAIWEPERRHYERWASTRGGWKDRVDEAIDARRSIHAHFYSRDNTATLLQYAVQELDFSGFHIRHTPNHRDFFWTLTKA